jgi:serpin B
MMLLCQITSTFAPSQSIRAASREPNAASPAHATATGDQFATIVGPANWFTLDMYHSLRGNHGNLLFSPAGIFSALTMMSSGAAGATKTEMVNTLHIGLPDEELQSQLAPLRARWQVKDRERGLRLYIANRAWGQLGVRFEDSFIRTSRAWCGADIGQLDFRNEPEKARDAVNRWVEAKTAGLITDFISSGTAIKDARLVLTNAVYFKGQWTFPFDSTRTKQADFHLTATQSCKAAFMQLRNSLRYSAGDGLQIVELPYDDGRLSLFVLLTEKIDGLPGLEARLQPADLERWLSLATFNDVIVHLPRFRTTSQFDLGKNLRTMGMSSAFDPSTANFSGISRNTKLFISAVFHKAYAEINEEGTQASAATNVIASPKSIAIKPATPVVFRADHPFIYLIRDNRSGSILFIGRMLDPTK